jgi:hypothetical protein
MCISVQTIIKNIKNLIVFRKEKKYNDKVSGTRDSGPESWNLWRTDCQVMIMIAMLLLKGCLKI